MKKYIIMLLMFWVILLLGSCSIQKRLDKYCPLCVKETETITETVYKDSIIKIPGETVTVIDSLYCDSLGNVYNIRLYEKDGEILKLKTSLNNNRYTVDCKADTVFITVQLPSKIIKEKITLDPVKITTNIIPWWVSFLATLGSILFLILVIYFTRKLIKMYSSNIL